MLVRCWPLPVLRRYDLFDDADEVGRRESQGGRHSADGSTWASIVALLAVTGTLVALSLPLFIR